MGGAWIDGRPAAVEAAAAEAAHLLGASRMTVIAGLGTDVRGARAAVALAERIGGAVDHMHATAVLRDIDVLREAGMMLTTPNEAGLRADLVVLVGAGLTTAWPDMPQRLIDRAPGEEVGNAFVRRVIRLCPGRGAAAIAGANARTIGRDPAELSGVLAALRARVAGRPVGTAPVATKLLDALVAELQAARFGVAVWSAGGLDVLTIEMLCGLIGDLNAKTRFSGCPVASTDNAAGVVQACGWMTGFPIRTGFGRGFPEHDPWRYDAARLVESGEADCALWISAYRAVTPEWRRDVPLIALCADGTTFKRSPRVQIAVGRPGADHAGVEYLFATGTLAPVAATAPSDAISVADVIGRITAHVPAKWTPVRRQEHAPPNDSTLPGERASPC
jgi:formylmethanofuran dehydrogenase subunit B